MSPSDSGSPSAYDVVIVGAGPVGVILANLLGQRGVNVLIIDAEKGIVPLPRAIGCDEEGARILQATGLMPEIAEGMVAMDRVVLRSPAGGTLVDLDTTQRRYGFPRLQMFRQPELEKVLRTGLQRFPHVRLQTGTRCTAFSDEGGGVRLSLEEEERRYEIRCRFLIGCDGARSFVRERLGIRLRGATYAQDWLVIDVANDPAPSGTIVFDCDPRRPSVTMSGPFHTRRWEFMLTPADTRESIAHPDCVRRLLAPWGDLDAMQVDRQAVYTFHARVADRFRAGNVFLAGDAAHLTPPFAGQGLMSGFRDAYNLAWKLAAVIEGTAAETLLDSYEIERRPHVRQMTRFARLLGHIIMPTSRSGAAVRDGVIAAMKRIPRLREHLTDFKLKPKNGLRRGFIEPRARKSAGLVGQEFPQLEIEDAAGTRIPSDEGLGHGWCIVGVDRDPRRFLSAATVEQWKRIGTFVCLQQSADRLPLDDQTYRIAEPIDTSIVRERFFVLRPDRHVYDVHDGAGLDAAIGNVMARLRGRPARAWKAAPAHSIDTGRETVMP